MKKLFLFLSAGLFVLSASAQQNNSIMLKQETLPANFKSHLRSVSSLSSDIHKSAGKTTDNSDEGWFNYFQELYIPGQGAEYLMDTYPDSTIYDNNVSSYMWYHGLGVSFDPTDSTFALVNVYNTDVSGNPYLPAPFVVTNSNTYTIDSVYINAKYFRSQNYTDSLILDLAITTGTLDEIDNSGAWKLDYEVSQDPTDLSYLYQVAADGNPRFADAIYDGPDDQISDSVISKVEVAIPLDSAAFVDTFQTGGQGVGSGQYFFVLKTPLSVPANGKVIAFAHFKSGFAYPFGTTTDSANYLSFLAGDPGTDQVFPMQQSANAAIGYPGSFQAGLFATSQITYNDTGFSILGHNGLIPNFAYGQPTQLDAPDWGFHIVCPLCTPLSVPTVQNVVSSANAYPSPANSELYVPFTLSASADVTVTLTNTLGQIVATQNMGNVTSGKATFNTSNLAGGIYFYTVNANGERSVGRVLIAH